ncbi:MFS transporter [Actinosynnema sp. NPDC020468]|uniref:MFS transporter n=1 Tax=Actinosynnema sp. NPDC020468 TaxID=3154488 RepID=UPI0033C60FA7
MTPIGEQASDSTPRTRSLRDYRLLFGAFLVSTAGDWLYKLALPLLVLQLTGSAVQTAVVYSLEYVPYLLFAPIGGVLSDRYDRRLLLIRADLAAAGVIGLLAVLAWFGEYHLWLIYPAAFVLSSITPLYQATFQGLLPATVPADRLGWANSRMQAGQGTLDLAGPLLGAAAVAALGARWALSLDAVSFGLSALAVALIARTRTARPHREASSFVGDLRTAVAFVRTHPPLLWGAIVAAGSGFGLFMIEANMITYLVRFRDQPVATVGVVFAALGTGSLLGALVTPRLLRLTTPGRLIIAATITAGAATALLLVLTALPTIAATWVLVGGATTVFIVTFFTLRHQLVPEHLLGRVVVLTRLIAFGPVPFAPVVGGALLSATGAFWPVITLSAAVQIGVGVVALASPLRTAAPEPVPPE